MSLSGSQSDPKAGQSDDRRELRFDLCFGRGQVRSPLKNMVEPGVCTLCISAFVRGRIAPELQLCRPHKLLKDGLGA